MGWRNREEKQNEGILKELVVQRREEIHLGDKRHPTFPSRGPQPLQVGFYQDPLGIPIIPTYKSRVGVRADRNGKAIAF